MPALRAVAQRLPARFWRLLGRSARLLRRHWLAARAYRVATHVAPQRAVYFHDLGTALATVKRHQAAINAFRQALSLDPQLGRSQRALGRMHRALGQHAQSARAFSRAVELLPADAQLFFELGSSLSQLGRHDAAADALSEALRLRPGQLGWYRAQGRALRDSGRHADAAVVLRQVAELQPQDVRAQYEEGREWLMAGACQPALAALRRALALQPQHADSLLALHQCRQQQPPALPKPPARVGCVLGGGIGNLVQCSPAIRHLASTLGQPVDLLLNEDAAGCAQLFVGAPWVGTVYASVAEAHDQHFTLLIVLDPFTQQLPALHAERLVAPRIVLPLAAMQQVHEAEYYLQGLQQSLGIAYRAQDIGAYFVGRYQRQPGFPRRVGLHAGCKGGRWRAKRWPYFVELAQRLTAAGLEVVSVGGADEAVPGTLDCTGLTLDASIEMIATCAYFIANDSGLMHIADALGIPLTSIFAPSSVTKNGPLARSSQVVQLHKACAPCQFDTARLNGCTCIGEISLDSVWSKVQQHLRSVQVPVQLPLPMTAPRLIPVYQAPPRHYSSQRLQRLLAAQDWSQARAMLDIALNSLELLLALGQPAFEQVLHSTWVLAAQQPLTGHAQALAKAYPHSVLAICECAACVLEPAPLDALILHCAEPILAANAAQPLLRLLTAACRHASPQAVTELVRRLDASAHRSHLHNPAVASQLGEALLASDHDFTLAHSGLRASELRRQAPLERLIEQALWQQDRPAFIHAVNAHLAQHRGAQALTRLLKNLGEQTARLQLAAGDIHYDRADSHADNLLLALHLHDAAMVELSAQQGAADGLTSILQRSRQHDYAPLNAALARDLILAGAAPLSLAGTDRLTVFQSALHGPSLPAAAEHGLVSVILCAHAPDPDLLRLAVDSVLRQTYRQLELIVVDDGNTPAAAELLARLAGPRVRVIRSPHNIGVYPGRNLGIAAARGTFITFHDADDIAHPQRLELQLAALLATPGSQICYASHIRFDAAGGVQLEINPNRLNLLGDGPVTALLRRSTLAAIGPLANVRSRGDIELRQRIGKCFGAHAVLQLDAPLLYCTGGAGTLSNRAMACHRQQIRLLRQAFQRRAWPAVVEGELLSPAVGELAIPPALRGGTPAGNLADLAAASAAAIKVEQCPPTP